MALKNEQCPATFEAEGAGPTTARVFVSCPEDSQKDVMSTATGFTMRSAETHGREEGEEFKFRCQTLTEKCLVAEICQGRRIGMYGWRSIGKNNHPRLNFSN